MFMFMNIGRQGRLRFLSDLKLPPESLVPVRPSFRLFVSKRLQLLWPPKKEHYFHREKRSKSHDSTNPPKRAAAERRPGKLTCRQRLKTNGLIQRSQMLCREDKQPFWHI